MNLILDWDGTLVSEGDEPVARPHLRDFLDFVFAHFARVSIWSAASPEWVKEHMQQMGVNHYPWHFVWAGVAVSRQIRQGRLVIHKRLKKVCKKWPEVYTLHNTIVVDNLSETFAENWGNGVHVTTFEGQRNDQTLVALMDIIPQWMARFAEVQSVRFIEKRGLF